MFKLTIQFIVQGIFLLFEVCRKKTDPNNISFRKEYEGIKKTAATTLHLTKSTGHNNTFQDDTTTLATNPSPDIFLGDSWFTSIDVVKNISGYFIGNIKANSKGYPKTYLLNQMKDWPSGSYLTLKANIAGLTLYAMGYKYCHTKVILFLFNKGAGHT